MEKPFFPKLHEYMANVLLDVGAIAPERKTVLDELAAYILRKHVDEVAAKIIFICTHNSRRSHFGQVWGQAAAAYLGLGHVLAFSGGTEATAMAVPAAEALKAAGFSLLKESGENPMHHFLWAEGAEPIQCFSKKYDDATNPTEGFCAVMTCSDADEKCPFIAGAELRLPIRYKDPKVADGTPHEAERYSERCRQVAAEMLYVMQTAKRSIDGLVV